MMRRSVRGLRRLLVPLLVVGSVLGAVFVVGMRTKSPGVQRAVRRMNKAVVNPKVLETAGTPGAPAAVVRHVGRRSGTPYETPVVAAATEDGFAIAMPYGPGADWVRNVLAAGRATITHEGESYEVDRPEIVPTAGVDAYFGESDRRSHRAFRIDQSLRLRRVGASTG